MHVLHYLAVEATSSKKAFDSVKDRLNAECNGEGFWSDWHVVGGGRWSDNSDYEDKETPKNVISYVKDKEKFTKALKVSRDSRKQEMKFLIECVKKEEGEATFFISALDFMKKGDINPINMTFYYIHKMSQMLLGNWNCNSFFFDLEANSASFDYLEERIKSNPKKQYLVPVDFHF